MTYLLSGGSQELRRSPDLHITVLLSLTVRFSQVSVACGSLFCFSSPDCPLVAGQQAEMQVLT